MLVNLLIVALIVVGALFLGFLNALAGDPLSGPAVDAIRAAFVALLLLVPGLVFYRQITRAGTRGSAGGGSPPPIPPHFFPHGGLAPQLGPTKGPGEQPSAGEGR